jgi:hypothetical protein
VQYSSHFQSSIFGIGQGLNLWGEKSEHRPGQGSNSNLHEWGFNVLHRDHLILLPEKSCIRNWIHREDNTNVVGWGTMLQARRSQVWVLYEVDFFQFT